MYYIPGIVVSFFLTLILLSKKNRTQADYILALWLLFLGVHLSLIYAVVSGIARRHPFLLGLAVPLPLVQGPFLFLYVASLTGQVRTRYSLLHFIPVCVMYLILVPFYLLPGNEKIQVYEQSDAAYRHLIRWNFAAIIVSGIVYIILSFIKLRRHQRNIGDRFSNTEKINLLWLKYLVMGIGLVWSVIIIGAGDHYIYAAVTLFILFMGYFGIKQVGIFTNKESLRSLQFDVPSDDGTGVAQDRSTSESTLPQHTETAVPVNPEPMDLPGKAKYSKSGLNDQMASAIHQRLTLLMNEEKPYTNPDLTLSQLAQRLQVPDNYLSQVINSLEQKSFYDYINIQRIEAFRKIVVLPGNKQYTLLSLAFECGFNSKTSFNRNFKKHTGLSPSQYLEKESIRLS